MSKRARITLPPIEPDRPDKDTETSTSTHSDTRSRNDSTAAGSPRPEVSVPAGWVASTGTIIKVVAAGLAVVSLVLLWKSRRP